MSSQWLAQCPSAVSHSKTLPRKCLGEDGFSVTQMEPEDFLGSDRSPSGPVCGGPALWYWIGRVALFVMFADVALSQKSPYLGSAWVRMVFSATRYRLVRQDLVGRSLGGSWRS